MNYLLTKKYVYIPYFLFVNRVSKKHKRKVGLMSCLQQLPFKELSENTNLENRVLKKHPKCQKDHGLIWCLQQLPFKGLLENIKSAQKYVFLVKQVFSLINFLCKLCWSKYVLWMICLIYNQIKAYETFFLLIYNFVKIVAQF